MEFKPNVIVRDPEILGGILRSNVKFQSPRILIPEYFERSAVTMPQNVRVGQNQHCRSENSPRG
jgi:hypothetical protein